MTKHDDYDQGAVAQELSETTETLNEDSIIAEQGLAAIKTSVELGIRSVVFYAAEFIGLKGQGEAVAGKIENDELEYEVVVRCKKKSKIITL